MSTQARQFLASYTCTAGDLVAGVLPPSEDEAFDLKAAYTVEGEFRRLRTEAGRTVVGRKVGYANKAMWRALKLETLVWASMYDDTVQTAIELSLKNFITPKLEPEIVFKLKSPMSGEYDAAGALEAVEWLAIGFEIIDCPYPDWKFKPSDFVAAYGLHRALVVGETHPADSTLVDALATFKLKLFKNGQLTEEGSGRNSLRSPALCLAELARVTSLEKGELISTGTLTTAQSIAPGDTWRAEVEGLPLSKLEMVVHSQSGGREASKLSS